MVALKSEGSLKECPVDAGLVYAGALVAILALKRSIARNVVSYPNCRAYQIFHTGRTRDIPNWLVQRPMNIFEAIIRFPFVFQPWKPVSQLDIKCLAVKCLRSSHVTVMNIGEFG